MRTCLRLALVAWLLAAPLPAFAQYAEVPRPLPAGAVNFFGFTLAGQLRAATQIGRRLFIGGRFTQLASATGGAAVVDPLGVVQPQALRPPPSAASYERTSGQHDEVSHRASDRCEGALALQEQAGRQMRLEGAKALCREGNDEVGIAR